MNRRKKEDKISILLVDDEETFLEMMQDTLRPRGCQVSTALNAEQAEKKLKSRYFDVVVLDVRMPGMDGVSFLSKLADERPTQQVIMLTGHATVSMAVQAMKLGAFDFLMKPVEVDELLRTIKQASEQGRLKRRNIALEKELKRTRGSGRIIGESEQIKRIHEFIETAVASDLPVLITGETGTGKELVAQAIHANSLRSDFPIVVVDGSVLREELLASELFGHEKGAFTGAVSKKVGLFEVADRGTLFLDEIGEISFQNQSSLLRVIEHGVFRPVGGVKEVKTNVRILAATNKNIDKAVTAGEFRSDLFYRLKGLTVNVPPLRERKSDIPLLAEHFLTNRNTATGQNIKISEEAMTKLSEYDWPGNVRELKYVIELAELLARKTEEIQAKHLPDEIRGHRDYAASEKGGIISPILRCIEEKPSMTKFSDCCERYYISRLLEDFDGNKSKVARALKISSSTLYTKLHRLGLD
ncbi:response regulator [candidate division WOR-3 bacterium]|uniref:Response regulator n=1 Tax=candidate division WOR-3 bacterium TaxID=2052148 RepID=A0A9D5KCH2_UNCW3|nr:response regulator [candidate division WOR-3 bacterium]MBD3365674.1 response regulator [candidate division WOR-3 bacterium]